MRSFKQKQLLRDFNLFEIIQYIQNQTFQKRCYRCNDNEKQSSKEL